MTYSLLFWSFAIRTGFELFLFSLSKTFHYHLSIRRKTKITKPKKKLLLSSFFFQFHHFHEWMNKQWKRRKSTFLNADKCETSDEKQTYFQSDVPDEMVTKLASAMRSGFEFHHVRFGSSVTSCSHYIRETISVCVTVGKCLRSIPQFYLILVTENQ